MGDFMYRVWVTCINIIFPPLSILLICGPGWDLFLNCAFFLLAIIPSHIHGFYLTCTYFHRRKKVKKGRYPGGPKSMIDSHVILNGGASDAEVERLWRKENGLSRRSSRRNSGNSMRPVESRRPEMAQRPSSNLQRMSSNRSTRSGRGYPLTPYDSQNARYIAQDGYGPVQRTPSFRTHPHPNGYSPISPSISQFPPTGYVPPSPSTSQVPPNGGFPMSPTHSRPQSNGYPPITPTTSRPRTNAYPPVSLTTTYSYPHGYAPVSPASSRPPSNGYAPVSPAISHSSAGSMRW